jgi:hypothetical protein
LQERLLQTASLAIPAAVFASSICKKKEAYFAANTFIVTTSLEEHIRDLWQRKMNRRTFGRLANNELRCTQERRRIGTAYKKYRTHNTQTSSSPHSNSPPGQQLKCRANPNP